MNISYHWLKEYVDADLNPDELADVLTMLGLEVGKIERSGAIPGNLKGVVVGEVKAVVPHPNADRLRLCQVDVGQDELLSIVCGAPNVAKGQKVPVATVGATLYPFGQGEEGAFKIKKGKIRGEVSLGMICAEDELGIGPGHDGIMVLAADAPVGAPMIEQVDIKEEVVLEIDLTPNRVDAASHYGVARDLAAYLGVPAKLPALSFDPDSLTTPNPIPVRIEATEKCQRYSSLYISGVTVQESPEWLKERLMAIGLRPINHVADVTNYVLHELGHPMHAFDADKLAGGEVVVRTVPEKETFVTLDGVERELLPGQDLLICDGEKPQCIAGTMGGLHSGVTFETQNIFLESAWFEPGTVRRTAKRLGLNSDSSFRFERGADPHMTITAALRAADLIVQIGGGTISQVSDEKLQEFPPYPVALSVQKVQRLAGADISREEIIRILEGLEIAVDGSDADLLQLQIPFYRVDVQRDVDVIEDILRVYGYNKVELPAQMHTSLDYRPYQNDFRLREHLANYYAANGYYEILNNSLVPAALGDEHAVTIANPLSEDLGIMRQSMLPGALETLQYNQNRQQESLQVFEFGKTYRKRSETEYAEKFWLTLTVAGPLQPPHWQVPVREASLFTLTKEVERLQAWGGFSGQLREVEDPEFQYGMELIVDGRSLLQYGKVHHDWQQRYDLRQEAFHLRMDWEAFLQVYRSQVVRYQPVPMYPAVRRDISLLLDLGVSFQDIQQVISKANPKLIRAVELHDVYRGKGVPEHQKSYLVSIELRDDNKTLADQAVDKIMQHVLKSLEKQVGASLRA